MRDLLETLGLDDLLPASLSAWRPLLSEGLLHFLRRLTPSRQAAIVAGQLALPASASPSERLVALALHSPTLHKLGQVVARHPLLPAELRRQLQTLESLPPTLPMERVAALVRAELGPRTDFVLADAPLAEGSVAVVVPFTWRREDRMRHGVFKVLKPGVTAQLAAELALVPALGRFLEARARRLGLPRLGYRDSLESVADLLAHETRLNVEQHNLSVAAAFHAAEPRLLVPRLLPWCTPRLTAMERVFGVKLADANVGRATRRELADTLVSGLLARPFWSTAPRAVFHADLHGGNLLLAEDGRVAVLDWSLTATLSKAQRETLVSIVMAGLAFDAARMRRAIAALGAADADDPTLAECVDAALERLVRQRQLPGFDWLLTLLDDIALRARTAFRGDLTLFRKTWLSLGGVIRDVAGCHSPDPALLRVGLQRFADELPRRLFAAPDSHAFATHLSNLDLTRGWAASWLASLRYWSRFWRSAP